MEQTPAHDIANRDLVRMIPANASRVVEVGCSVGALAREYRRSNPGCDYVGIETDPRYAEMARAHCSRVLVADIERLGDAEIAALGPADCWVFGDVLEHLIDPWALLARLRPHTRAVVTCVPNMQHWSVVLKLVRGDLFYEDRGLLDRTHLRWFTRETLATMFGAAGYGVESMVGRVFEQQGRAESLAALHGYAQALGLDTEAVAQDADVMQWLVVARPRPASSGA